MVNSYTRLLAAALLMMAGLSAGMRHAHQGGESAHDHEDANHRLAMLGAQFASPGGAGWFSAPLHMHIFLLGFQFTVPAEEESGDSETDSGEHLVVVRILGDELSDSVARVGAVVEDFSATSPATDIVVVPATLPEAPLERVRALPLCDNARHERSGVQLS